jgi:mannose-6-phosphate isomerase-like protein (cupin superfamily)
VALGSIEEWVGRVRRTSDRYHEFLRVPSMSAGVYVLPSGAVDGQSPHREDEVYYVVQGRSRFTQGGSDRAVGPGDVLFVPAQQVHQFHSIQEELVLLVVFAPAETSPP